MLRITTETERFESTLRLEGRLAGPWVDELARTWGELQAVRDAGSIRVDLDGVTFVSSSGKSLLRRIHREGARLVAGGWMARAIVEEIES
jgi:ABC-type transporter Mla MlaB component